MTPNGACRQSYVIGRSRCTLSSRARIFHFQEVGWVAECASSTVNNTEQTDGQIAIISAAFVLTLCVGTFTIARATVCWHKCELQTHDTSNAFCTYGFLYGPKSTGKTWTITRIEPLSACMAHSEPGHIKWTKSDYIWEILLSTTGTKQSQTFHLFT